LMAAAAGGHAQCVQLLLDGGADVAVVNRSGFTALMAAAVGGYD
jgi:ankyrin repeat protein